MEMIYGLGERRNIFLLPSGTYTLFAQDVGPNEIGAPGH